MYKWSLPFDSLNQSWTKICVLTTADYAQPTLKAQQPPRPSWLCDSVLPFRPNWITIICRTAYSL